MKANGTRVYLAAPLFSKAERVRNKVLRDAISSFANVYLPQEDGGILLDLVRDGTPVEQAKSQIFHLDIEAIRGL
ncbi:nucleoside 2-deoxyribosyltransferase [Bradyrhizobium sp. GM0.4]